MLTAEIERKLNATEYLAVDNLVLARRVERAERQLERERRLHGGGRSIMGGLLLGWDRDKDEAEQERVAELEAVVRERMAAE